mgnify:FL=1
MSDIRFEGWLHRSGTGGVYQDSAGNVGIASTQPKTNLDIGNGAFQVGPVGICTVTTVKSTNIVNSQPLTNRNFLINSSYQIAQRGTSSSTINDYVVDRWRTFGGPSGFTISRIDDATYATSGKALRMHRTNGNSQTNNHGFGQGIETLNSLRLAGQSVILSFKAKRGADFSGSGNTINCSINAGEGTDENPFGMTNTNSSSQSFTLLETDTSHTLTFDVPSDKTQVTVLFNYTPTGTAGVNDWFEIADCQLEMGTEATPFEYVSVGDELARCYRYCYVISDGAIGMGAQKASDQIIGHIQFPATMRATPTATTDSLVLRIDSGLHLESSSSGTFTLSEAGPRSTGYKMTGFSGGLANGSGFFVKENSGSITLSAEL